MPYIFRGEEFIYPYIARDVSIVLFITNVLCLAKRNKVLVIVNITEGMEEI